MSLSKHRPKMNIQSTSSTKTASKLYIKRVLAISISTITYMRNIFPENAFCNIRHQDIDLKMLTRAACNGSKVVIEWMAGVYDALDNEFLKSMMFAFLADPNDPNSVLETYSFSFKYTNGEVETNMEASTGSTPPSKIAHTSAKRLIRNLLLLTNSMADLPEDVHITTFLSYYNDRTPKEYQPPGFIAARKSDLIGAIEDNIKLKVGDVKTPFYDVILKAIVPKTEFMKEAQTSRENSQRMQEESEEKLPSFENQLGCGVRCPCGNSESDEQMLLCTLCNYLQHAVCFGVPQNRVDKIAHLCCWCPFQDKNLITDQSMVGMSDEERKELCLWRRALQFCTTSNTITAVNIREKLKCSKILSQKIFSKLSKHQVVNTKRLGGRISKTVDQHLARVLFAEQMSTIESSETLSQALQQMNVKPSRDHDESFKSDNESLMNHKSEIERSVSVTKKRRLFDDSGMGSDSIYDFPLEETENDFSSKYVAKKPRKRQSKKLVK